MRHGRQTKVPHRGRRATPWKYLVAGKPVRRGQTYYVRCLLHSQTLWEGEVTG